MLLGFAVLVGTVVSFGRTSICSDGFSSTSVIGGQSVAVVPSCC